MAIKSDQSGNPISFIDLVAQYKRQKTLIDERIQKVLEHGQFILGPEVAELEQALIEFTGAQHCVSVASGTDALLLSLMALGIGSNDEVITTPFTFVSTVEVIVRLGAIPVFADVEADTGNIDATAIEALIGPRTRAIMPVSLYGQPSDMDSINALAEKYADLPVIEDAAQSFGALYKNRRSCNLSTIGCTSFFPSKPFGAFGDGGAIFTNSAVLAQICRELSVHGQGERFVHKRVGLCSRLDTLQAAILLAKLHGFDAEIAARREVGRRYDVLLNEAGIQAVVQRSDRSGVYAQYSVMVDDRDAVCGRLQSAGIPFAIYYPRLIYQQPAYQHLQPATDLPVACRMATKVLSLPMHSGLEHIEQVRVVECLLG